MLVAGSGLEEENSGVKDGPLKASENWSGCLLPFCYSSVKNHEKYQGFNVLEDVSVCGMSPRGSGRHESNEWKILPCS